MPELPEVQALAVDLSRRLSGRLNLFDASRIVHSAYRIAPSPHVQTERMAARAVAFLLGNF